MTAAVKREFRRIFAAAAVFSAVFGVRCKTSTEEVYQYVFEQKIETMALRSDSVNARYGSPGVWQSWMLCFETARRAESEQRMAEEVNAIINANIRYTPDSTLYGEKEYYAPPLSCVMNGKGDCEDYAILKASTLMSLGFDPSRLALVAVNEDRGAPTSNHVVLKINFGTAEKPDEWIYDINNFEKGGTFAPVSEALEKYRFYAARQLTDYRRIVPKPLSFTGT